MYTLGLELIFFDKPFLQKYRHLLFRQVTTGTIKPLDDDALRNRYIRWGKSHALFFTESGQLIGRAGCRYEPRQHWFFWRKLKPVFFNESIFEALRRHRKDLHRVHYCVWFGFDRLIIYGLPHGISSLEEWVDSHPRRMNRMNQMCSGF